MPSPDRNSEKILLRVSGVSKSYAVKVLDQVHFELRPGEVHALVGENGAGKSTLARIIAGMTEPDSGSLSLREAPFSPRSKTDAEHQGVRMVLQELNLIPTLTVAENIYFDQIPHRFGWIDYPLLDRRAAEIMAQVGLNGISPAQPVHTLGVGQQQLVEIAAGLSRRCDVLILDEPTAALTQPEIERLFVQVNRLKQIGVGIIYISHRLEEIQSLADRISVLRDGQIMATRSTKEITIDEIVRLMVGRDLGKAVQRQPPPRQIPVLRVRSLRSGTAVREVSFDLHQGEILGLAGLMGSGRTETVRGIFGADRADGGSIFLGDSNNPLSIQSPRDAVRHGIALLTEDRKGQGLLLPLPIRSNISLLCLRQLSSWGGWLRTGLEAAEAKRWTDALKLRCHSTEQPVVQLSGGNQQKVVIARWLFRDCNILIFDEPTRGIDVGAKFEIYQLLARLAGRGKAILVVSSDLKELIAICDRMIVMSAGRVAANLKREEWTEEKIMAAALSGYLGKPGARSE